jgi:hypothetical protein
MGFFFVGGMGFSKAIIGGRYEGGNDLVRRETSKIRAGRVVRG